MLTKMLKPTMILLVLMAFFVAPPSILSNGNNGSGSSSDIGDGWGSPVNNKTCKGVYDPEVSGSCPSLPSECTGSVEYKVNSESEGCVTESYGSVCYTKTVTHRIGTAPCELHLINGDYYCTTIPANLPEEEFTDCKVLSTMN